MEGKEYFYRQVVKDHHSHEDHSSPDTDTISPIPDFSPLTPDEEHCGTRQHLGGYRHDDEHRPEILHIEHAGLSSTNHTTHKQPCYNHLRVLLVQTAHGLSPSSGGYRANYSLLLQLLATGHDVAQICYGSDHEVEAYAQRALKRGIEPHVTETPFMVKTPGGAAHRLNVKTFTDHERVFNIVIPREAFLRAYPLRELFKETKEYLESPTDAQGNTSNISNRMQILIDLFSSHFTRFEPTHIIFNDAMTMKLTAHHPLRKTFKRVAIIHTAEQLPFGPFCQGIEGHCLSPRVEATMLPELDGIWAVSRAIQDYAMKYGNLKTTFLVHSTFTYLDLETKRLPRVRHNVDKLAVGMVNPCPHKGEDILLGLAKDLPDTKFIAWVSWGSSEDRLQRLRELPNIEIRPTTRNTNEIWDNIKVLICPSVWYEAWGIIVTEAQLRGIPVIASNAGGLAEAKLGLPYTVPVRMVTGPRDTETGYYIVPEQDIAPWTATLEHLMTHREEYVALSDITVKRSAEWLLGMDPRAHEKWLLAMVGK